ncbi:citrate synthase-lysine N-methyltransferase CSKMT, mitochondrial [Macrotis lagotis]|uniref:citrate synthase-lysine N-methyltransferase CSKMT, mitochondrial n=1 Tax=Macrotis lagotis TaxID=92651 RepID=UPI003D693D29
MAAAPHSGGPGTPGPRPRGEEAPPRAERGQSGPGGGAGAPRGGEAPPREERGQSGPGAGPGPGRRAEGRLRPEQSEANQGRGRGPAGGGAPRYKRAPAALLPFPAGTGECGRCAGRGRGRGPFPPPFLGGRRVRGPGPRDVRRQSRAARPPPAPCLRCRRPPSAGSTLTRRHTARPGRPRGALLPAAAHRSFPRRPGPPAPLDPDAARRPQPDPPVSAARPGPVLGGEGPLGMAAPRTLGLRLRGAERSWAAGHARGRGARPAGGCLADPRLWGRLHAQGPPGSPAHFDWFFGYEEVQGLLLGLLQEGAPGGRAGAPLRVLDVGCGTSDLCRGLYTRAPLPLHVLGVDFSSAAVSRMKHLVGGGGGHPGHPDSRLHFRQADGRHLGSLCPSDSFQLVLDKGTWDAVARAGPAGAQRLLSECLRVLAPRGTLVQFSDEDPDVRLPCLERGAGGSLVTVQELGPFRGLSYFAYLVQKAQ